MEFVFQCKTSLPAVFWGKYLKTVLFSKVVIGPKGPRQSWAGKSDIIGHFVFLVPVALTRAEPFCQGCVPLIKEKEGWEGQTRKNSKGNGLALSVWRPLKCPWIWAVSARRRVYRNKHSPFCSGVINRPIAGQGQQGKSQVIPRKDYSSDNTCHAYHLFWHANNLLSLTHKKSTLENVWSFRAGQ